MDEEESIFPELDFDEEINDEAEEVEEEEMRENLETAETVQTTETPAAETNEA